MANRSTDKKNASTRALYAEFLRYPTPDARRADGFPATKQEFAAKYHVSRPTLWRWEHDAEFRREVHNECLNSLSLDEVERIKMALKVKAFEGQVSAARLLLEWAGIFGKNASTPLSREEEPINFDDMSDEELMAFISQEDDAELELVSAIDAC